MMPQDIQNVVVLNYVINIKHRTPSIKSKTTRVMQLKQRNNLG